MNLAQIAMAAHLAGRSQTAEEIALQLASTPRAVRQGLKLANIRLDSKPFGFRPVTAHLSPPQIDGLRVVADQQGLAGVDRHAAILEQIGRRLGANPDLLKSVLDATKRPLFIEDAVLETLRADAKKRALSVHELATRIIEAVGRDKIVGAVVDD